ncbi:PREDICTED: circadian clock-controlled protein-like [Vollenhovia emeryi]|uniref:circadian clock-controlled protein-like n=1 Tax=Vollenhovia emeryi TaxID=411798 RepID=UPI0005F37E9E|nr:PREDICTED: circadian clock-controlled protein-like [Vollenhovia emeryi]
MEEAWPRFMAGLPEYNFPPLDPLFYEYGRVSFGPGIVNGELIVSNVTLIGLSNSRVVDVTTHYFNNTFHLDLDIKLPTLFIKGALDIDGTISLIRIVNKGDFNLTAEDVMESWKIAGHVINDTWVVEQFHLVPSFKKFKVYHKSKPLYNERLANFVVNFINQFWPILSEAALPFMSNYWDSWSADVTNKFFSKVSFSKIFP